MFKVAFRFERDEYTDDRILETNEKIKVGIQTKLAQKEIRTIRIYAPSRNSIKALFPSEKELNKVFINHSFF